MSCIASLLWLVFSVAKSDCWLVLRLSLLIKIIRSSQLAHTEANNALWLLSAGPFWLSWVSSVHSSTLYRWKLGLWRHASNRLVLSLISVSLLYLALLYISNLSLLHSLQWGVPNVWTVASGFPCHRMEYSIWDLTSVADTVPGLKFISAAAKNFAADVLLFPVSWHWMIWEVWFWNLVFAWLLVDPM